MQPLSHYLSTNPLGTLALLAALLLGLATIVLPIVCGILYGVYFLLTLPMRRNERARLFLDLLELGINDGQTPERAIINAARSRDRSLGARFQRLGRHLESGHKLSVALELVPRLLPRPVWAMLRAGEQLGDMSQTLPACRQLLRDGVSHVRGALNYLVVLGFCVTPFMISVPLLLRIKVLPQFTAVFEGMGVSHSLPAFTQMVFGMSNWFTLGSTALLGLVWLLLL